MNLEMMTIKQLSEGLRKKEFTSLEITEACLKKSEERNPRINAYITISREDAIISAKTADVLLKKGDCHPLCGIPLSVKDAICTEDIRSTGAAKILDNYIPPYEATVIKKIRDLGGVIVGKTNCDTLGHGASNENSMYGPVRNPADETKVAGGSSGGSAASVADHQCIYSIAEDTGGSIRQPASFCGVAGIRPSYGRNSRYGIMPMASSLDTVGPMAKNIEDLSIILEVMAGKDPKDATTVDEIVPSYVNEIKKDIKGMKIGVPKEYFEVEGMDLEVKKATEEAIKKMEQMGCEILPISLPHTKYAIAVYYIIVPCEDSSNLARLDGIRYGMRQAEKNLFDLYTESRALGFPEEVKRRILIGTYALSAGYYDAYYKKAQAVRTLIKQDFDLAFQKVDALLTPVSPFPAFGLGEKNSDPMALYLSDAFVSPAAVAGMPALSVPFIKNSSGLPIGMQFIGARMNEATILRLGHHLETN